MPEDLVPASGLVALTPAELARALGPLFEDAPALADRLAGRRFARDRLARRVAPPA